MSDRPVKLEPPQAGETLVEVLRAWAGQQPDKVAFTFLEDGEQKESCITYAELDQRARALAARLQSLGSRGRVLLLYPTGLEFVVAFLGCQYAGVAPVPMAPPDPTRLESSLPRLLAIAADAQPSFALTTTALAELGAALLPEGSGLPGCQWLASDATPANLACAWRQPEINAQSLAFIQYTSGSTRFPRGVMISHQNVLRSLLGIQTATRGEAADRLVCWLPLFHDAGLVGHVLYSLFLGAHCCLLSPLDFLGCPARWLQAISRQGASVSIAPNFAYELCARKVSEREKRDLDLSCWRIAGNGAEPVRLQTLQRFASVFGECGFRYEAFYPIYGLAESTVGVACKSPPDARPSIDGERVSCGRYGWDEQRLLIVNPTTRQRCEERVEGEIWVQSLAVAQGYWNRPDETRATFDAYVAKSGEGPFLRTGDLGYVYRQELYVTGRMKDLIIIRGANHYPQDIELTVEQSHPALRPGCGAAFSIDDGEEEQLVVVQEVRKGAPRANEPGPPPGVDMEEALRAICNAIAEEHGLQAQHVLLLEPSSIPKTSSGKIQRHACREQFLAGKLQVLARYDVAPMRPGGQPQEGQEQQSRLQVALWQGFWSLPADRQRARLTEYVRRLAAEALGLGSPGSIGDLQRLSDLGMDLPRAIALRDRLQASLDEAPGPSGVSPIRLRATIAFDYPTVEGLATYLLDELNKARATS